MQKEFSKKENNYVYFEEPNPGILKLFNLIGSNKKILDVGCGFGALGQEFKKQNNYVVGIDINQYAIDIAKTRLDQAYVCDITDKNSLNFLQENSFDFIIFADILEHLYDPVKILKIFNNYLKNDGHIIVSLPNIAAWQIRLKLLFGKFDYQETGILDKTHIKFFTKKTAKNLIENSGYKVKKIFATPYFIRALLPFVRKFFIKSTQKNNNPRAIIDSKVYKFYLKYFYPAESFLAKINTKFFAFQFIFYASKK
ncbi:MAG: class I SAM-dependent methyltransferase [Candidatus Babeliales bacterium]